MYLTDLAFIEEGTPNYTEDNLVNFSKMRMVKHVSNSNWWISLDVDWMKITVDNCTVVELENGSWTNWIKLYFSTSSPVKSYQIYQCCVFSPGHDLILSSFKMIGASVEWSIIICLWLKHRLWLLWKLWHVQKRLSLKDIDASCIISIFVDLQISHIIREIRQFQQTAYKIDYQPKVRLVIMWTSLQSLI